MPDKDLSSALDAVIAARAARRAPADAARDGGGAAAPETLRVALFSGNYNYVMDGPVRALNKLVAHLLKRGHEALVFAPTTRAPALPHEGEIVSIPSVPLPGRRREYRLGLGLFGEARRRLDAFKPNLIHVAAPDITGSMAVKYAETRAITPVASFHTRFDTYPRYYGARWLEPRVTAYMRNLYGRCQHVYAPSPSMVDELHRDGIGADVRLWTRGVDAAIFNPSRRNMVERQAQGFADDDVVVAFVGRLVLEKGIDVFADAIILAATRNPKIKALVVGDGPERARFQERLPTAVFLGHRDGEDLAAAYANADIFFNPSITETFGNVTLESMASGLPAVCAAASGSVSLVEDERTGLLSPPEGGAEGFADKLCRLAADRDLRRRFGEAGLAKSQQFDWDATLDRLIVQYREAIADRASGRGLDNPRTP